MFNTDRKSGQDATRERIVRAATQLFAERGLDGVTTREICTAAHVNGALVNYHFRSKEGLYRECVERLFVANNGAAVAALALNVRDEASWKAAMRRWIVGFSAAIHAESRADGGAGGIFRQEVVSPSALQSFLEERYGRPVLNVLKKLLAMAVGTPREVDLWATSIWSQLSAYALVAPVWQRHFRPRGTSPAKWGEEFAEFVCARVTGELKFKKKA